MQNRPIRELVNPKVLRPTAKGSVPRERRKKDRFTCRLPAVLVCGEKELPVECHEISHDGMRINTQQALHLKAGEHVVVRIRVGAQSFADAFSVVRIARNAQGLLSIHLCLEAVEPAATSAE